MTILVKKDSISSKINTVYYVVPASVRAIFIQDFAKGEISYKGTKSRTLVRDSSCIIFLCRYCIGRVFSLQ